MNTEKINELLHEAENTLQDEFKRLEEIALFNQEKVLNAFRDVQLAARHFTPSSGYGYDDIGRDTLCRVFANVFGAEAAIVSPLLASGTHTITVALFGLLRPGEKLLSISGAPYDTLQDVIFGEQNGSLKDFKIGCDLIEMKDGTFDTEIILQKLKTDTTITCVFIGRSRGYSERNAFSIVQIEHIIAKVKAEKPNLRVIVDNCYGEFVEEREPTEVGADLVMGSLIKNPGGGLAPTGGYLCGKRDLIEAIANRLIAPSLGLETGSYFASYQPFFEGLFLSPHVVMNALKGSLLFGEVYRRLGFLTIPQEKGAPGDIITSICFERKEQAIQFCRTIQKYSPVDSHVVPFAWDMPGYDHEVIMAAGTFTQGASIELSADSPLKKPYIVYIQGGLTYEHVKIVLKKSVLELDLLP